MRLALIHQPPRSRPLPEDATVWRTCLREVAFVDEFPRDAAPGPEWLTDGNAYALLIEIVTGLRSPLIGETEVQAQFKAFLASLDPARSASVLTLGQRVLGAAKAIRQRHLQGFGAHSYGRLTLRHIPAEAHVVLVGTGALARDVRGLIDERRVAAQWGRGADRSSVRRLKPARAPAPTPSDMSVAIVIAAPVSAAALDAVLGCYPRIVSVVDLRSSDERTPLALDAHVVTLEDLFAEARQTGTLAAGHVDRARADIRQLGREYRPSPRAASVRVGRRMRLRILSRASDLAVLQAEMVARTLRTAWPDVAVTTHTRSAQGDRETDAALWALPDKGLFTADLSQALVDGDADLVVHSWKDLPIEPSSATVVAATLERADPRDVLLVRRDVVATRPDVITVLSSSPRRAWQLESSLAGLLPWPVDTVRVAPVRGNVPTRLAKLVAGDGDALVVAKAALDRLLAETATEAARAAVRASLERCHWMVLPLRAFPTAAAQGALAIEVAVSRPDLRDRLRAVTHGPTWDAVRRERAILQLFGGGCHAAVGVTVLPRAYGHVVSVLARTDDALPIETWSIDPAAVVTRVPSHAVWPRPDERDRATRQRLEVAAPPNQPPLWVSRADALPTAWKIPPDQLIWTAGSRTWARLAARGVWVHGLAEGLGDLEPADVDLLADRSIDWRRLSHAGSGDATAIATYDVEPFVPEDLGSRQQFFWSSGSQFLRAVARHPQILAAGHASGPGRTARVIHETLGDGPRASVWLEYEQWHRAVTL